MAEESKKAPEKPPPMDLSENEKRLLEAAQKSKQFWILGQNGGRSESVSDEIEEVKRLLKEKDVRVDCLDQVSLCFLAEGPFLVGMGGATWGQEPRATRDPW